MYPDFGFAINDSIRFRNLKISGISPQAKAFDCNACASASRPKSLHRRAERNLSQRKKISFALCATLVFSLWPIFFDCYDCNALACSRCRCWRYSCQNVSKESSYFSPSVSDLVQHFAYTHRPREIFPRPNTRTTCSDWNFHEKTSRQRRHRFVRFEFSIGLTLVR